jgi:hypothetical protein
MGFEERGKATMRHFLVLLNTFMRVVCLSVVGCCLLFLGYNRCAAQQTEVKGKTPPKEAWEPSPPPPDKFDWIQLISGEWLKGDLKRLYERKLEFDSDKLDLLEFDWEDVKQVRGHRVFEVRFEGPVTEYGLLRVTEDKVIVTVAEEKREYDRKELIAIAPGGKREIDYWSAKLTIGLDFTRGNTNQTQYSAIASAKRRTAATRFSVDYFGNFTRVEGVETINNQRVSGFFDIFKTRKLFYRPVFGEYYRDPIRNIDHRITVGGGLGYHIINTAKTEWDVSGGPAYQTTQFVSVAAGEDSSTSTPAFVIGTHYNTELTSKIDFDFNYRLNIMNEVSGRYTHHLVAAFETEMTKWLDFDISLIWDRTQLPQPASDGTVPQQDDFFIIFGLGLDFL